MRKRKQRGAMAAGRPSRGFFPPKNRGFSGFSGFLGSFDGGFSWEILISWPMYDLNLMIF